MPVTFSYFSEFLSTRKKEHLIIAVGIIWVVIEILMALVAWGLLSNPCLIDTHIGSMPFRSWRVFTMLCTLPAIAAALLFIILPESPSWLYIVSLRVYVYVFLYVCVHVCVWYILHVYLEYVYMNVDLVTYTY